MGGSGALWGGGGSLGGPIVEMTHPLHPPNRRSRCITPIKLQPLCEQVAVWRGLADAPTGWLQGLQCPSRGQHLMRRECVTTHETVATNATGCRSSAWPLVTRKLVLRKKVRTPPTLGVGMGKSRGLNI